MEEKETKADDHTGTIPKAPVGLTQSHLDQVVVGLDDSISTLVNDTVARRLWRLRTISAVQGE